VFIQVKPNNTHRNTTFFVDLRMYGMAIIIKTMLSAAKRFLRECRSPSGLLDLAIVLIMAAFVIAGIVSVIISHRRL